MTKPVDPKTAPRFTGIPTFMRAPYQEDPTGLDIALVGVPCKQACKTDQVLG